jgi:hypothetical protein
MEQNKNTMQNFKHRLNTINPLFIICGYLSLVSILILLKIGSYEYNLSSLIGIWKGFADQNSNLINKGFVIYNDGGYDGQFFYLISKSLFTEGLQSFPILDSFFLRFNRIGLPVLAGVLNTIIGFQFYPITTFLLLLFFHLLSFYLLYKILDSEIKYLSYFYLFSPFSLNSNLLLVSDSLFVSFAIICIYQIKIKLNEANASLFNFVLLFLISLGTCLIKESGMVIIFTFMLIELIDKNHKNSLVLLLSIVAYLIITQLFKLLPKIHQGTNPLGFLDLIDYPLFGFFKSIQLKSISNIKSLIKEFAKFPIFIFYIILILNLKNIINFRSLLLNIPIAFILFTAGVGEVGYWLSFDNISRMFTISIPWIILLKQENKAHNDYYALYLGFLIFLFLIIRIVFIKTPMTYYIY